jgi:hypothetical protein
MDESSEAWRAERIEMMKMDAGPVRLFYGTEPWAADEREGRPIGCLLVPLEFPTMREALLAIASLQGGPGFHEPNITTLDGKRIAFPGELTRLVREAISERDEQRSTLDSNAKLGAAARSGGVPPT